MASGSGLALVAAGASSLLASAAAAPLVIGADGVLCDLTKTLAGEAAEVS